MKSRVMRMNALKTERPQTAAPGMMSRPGTPLKIGNMPNKTYATPAPTLNPLPSTKDRYENSPGNFTGHNVGGKRYSTGNKLTLYY